MKTKLGILSLACASALALSHSLEAGIIDLISSTLTRPVPAEPPSMRVLLVHDVPGVILEVKGKYKIFDPKTKEQLSKSFQGKRRFIQALADGLRWGEEFPGVHQIEIVPSEPTSTIIVDGIEYQGTIYVYDVEGAISVVNKIPVEEYLNALLPLRYLEPLPEELLAALTITERTNCYYRMQNSKSKFWHVNAKKEGYHGYALNRRAAITAAILKTNYIVLQKNDAAFLLNWQPASKERYKGVTYSAIPLEEGEKMAKKGKNAAEILKRAFPEASLNAINHSVSLTKN